MSDSIYERTVAIARKAAAESAAGAAIRERMSGPLSVALAGRVNAGKSTLLNALLGEKLALTDATECTRVVSRYSHGQIYSASVVGPSGEVSPVSFERGPDGLRVPLSEGPGAPTLSITAPNPALRSMTLIDTPGLGSDDTNRLEATAAALGTEGRAAETDAVIYLLRHAHRSDVDTLEALRDRWAGNGSAFNVVAVLSRADEIGSGRLDAMESAAVIAERYDADGRLRGLATLVVPVSGLLAETGATLREEEFAWLRTLAGGSGPEVERQLLATSLFLDPGASHLTVEVRRSLLDRFGLFGTRLAITRMRDGSISDANALSRVLISVSGLERLREAITVQFGQRARVLQALTAIDGLKRIARAESVAPSWSGELESLDASAHELAELRALQALVDGLLDLSKPEQHVLTMILAAVTPSRRLGLPDDASTDEVRRAAISAIAGWRTIAANPLLNRLTVEACETAVRAAERIFAEAS